jgi:hypothetical protein
MKSNFDELFSDFEKFLHCQASFHMYRPDGVDVQQISYGTFRPLKDDNGRVHFPMDSNGYGYFITDDFDIIKTDIPTEQKRAIYRIEKNNVEYIGLYLYGIKE